MIVTDSMLGVLRVFQICRNITFSQRIVRRNLNSGQS